MLKETLSKASNQGPSYFKHTKYINPPFLGGLIVLKQWDTLLLQRRNAYVSFATTVPTAMGAARP